MKNQLSSQQRTLNDVEEGSGSGFDGDYAANDENLMKKRKFKMPFFCKKRKKRQTRISYWLRLMVGLREDSRRELFPNLNTRER